VINCEIFLLFNSTAFWLFLSVVSMEKLIVAVSGAT